MYICIHVIECVNKLGINVQYYISLKIARDIWVCIYIQIYFACRLMLVHMYYVANLDVEGFGFLTCSGISYSSIPLTLALPRAHIIWTAIIHCRCKSKYMCVETSF